MGIIDPNFFMVLYYRGTNRDDNNESYPAKLGQARTITMMVLPKAKYAVLLLFSMS